MISKACVSSVVDVLYKLGLPGTTKLNFLSLFLLWFKEHVDHFIDIFVLDFVESIDLIHVMYTYLILLTLYMYYLHCNLFYVVT